MNIITKNLLLSLLIINVCCPAYFQLDETCKEAVDINKIIKIRDTLPLLFCSISSYIIYKTLYGTKKMLLSLIPTKQTLAAATGFAVNAALKDYCSSMPYTISMYPCIDQNTIIAAVPLFTSTDLSTKKFIFREVAHAVRCGLVTHTQLRNSILIDRIQHIQYQLQSEHPDWTDDRIGNEIKKNFEQINQFATHITNSPEFIAAWTKEWSASLATHFVGLASSNVLKSIMNKEDWQASKRLPQYYNSEAEDNVTQTAGLVLHFEKMPISLSPSLSKHVKDIQVSLGLGRTEDDAFTTQLKGKATLYQNDLLQVTGHVCLQKESSPRWGISFAAGG